MDRYTQVYQQLKGPVVPLNICFTPAGKVNFAAMNKYVDWLCRQQVPVLLLTYGSSEFARLNDDDLWRLTAELAQTVDHRALFIASTGFWEAATCRRFLAHAEASGVDAVKVQLNPWGGQSDPDTFVGFHDRLQDAAPTPLLLWCNSGGQSPAPLQAVVKLARRPQFVGVKNDEDQFYYYYDLIRATSGHNFAVVSGGQMRNIAFGYQIGSPAYLCTIAPFRPDIALQFFDLLVAGDYPAAWQMVARYEDPWLQKAIEVDWLFAIKTAIRLHGLFPDDCSTPYRRDDPAKVDAVRQCLEAVFLSIPRAQL